MHWEDIYRSIAATQAGAVGIDQVSALGCAGWQWQRARTNGRWVAASRRVLLLDGTSGTDEQRVHAAVLDAGGGAALHADSALAWAGMRGSSLARIEVARCRQRRHDTSSLARIHRVRDLDESDIQVVRGVRSVTVLRAIWSEASRFAGEHWFDIGVRRIGQLLDDAHRARLVTWEALQASVDRLGTRGRAGTTVMRAVADERPPGSSPTDSRLEDRLEHVLEAGGLPRFERQCPVGGERPIGRVDHRDPTLPVVVETNSVAFHSLPSDRAADTRRYDALVAAGFGVAVVWEDDLFTDRASVVETVETVRRAARTGRAIVVHSPGCPWPDDPDRIVIRRRRPDTRG